MMKKRSIICLALLITSAWCSDTEHAGVRFTPSFLEARQMNTPVREPRLGHKEESMKGLELCVRVAADRLYFRQSLGEIQQDWARHPDKALVSLVDSEGNDLGRPSRIFMDWDAGLWSFVFDRFPSPKADWLMLKGEVPVEIAQGDEIKTERVLITKDKEEETMLGDFNIQHGSAREFRIMGQGKRGVITAHRVDFSITFHPGKYRIERVEFTNGEGELIQSAASFRKDGMRKDDQDNMTILHQLTLTEATEKLYASIVYRKTQRVTVPLEVKMDLYLQQREGNNNKSN